MEHIITQLHTYFHPILRLKKNYEYSLDGTT